MNKLKETTVLRENVKDRDGHLFKDELLQKFDGEEHIVLLNSDPKKILGKAKIKYEKGIGLTSEISFLETELGNAIFDCIQNTQKFYPSICGVIKKQNKESGELDIKLNSIGLTKNKNIDPEIKPLEIKEKEIKSSRLGLGKPNLDYTYTKRVVTKLLVNNLEEINLDYWVARAEELDPMFKDFGMSEPTERRLVYRYSLEEIIIDWNFVGPLIDKYFVTLYEDVRGWIAVSKSGDYDGIDSDPLTAIKKVIIKRRFGEYINES